LLRWINIQNCSTTQGKAHDRILKNQLDLMLLFSPIIIFIIIRIPKQIITKKVPLSII